MNPFITGIFLLLLGCLALDLRGWFVGVFCLLLGSAFIAASLYYPER